MVKLLLGVWLALAAQNTAVVQGTVNRTGTSEPIAGIEISLDASFIPRTARPHVTTDASGRFVFENVPLGKYVIYASGEGYFTYPGRQALPFAAATFAVDSPRTQQVTVELTPGGRISGHITDPQGNPLPNVSVSAAEMSYQDGRKAFAPGTIPIKTDDRGEYRVFWLPSGEYYIRAEQTGAGNLAGRSYYPGTLDSNIATPVTIRSGESIEGINFRLPPTNNIRISGTVKSDSGAMPNATIVRTFYLLPRDGRPTEFRPQEFTNTIRPQFGVTTMDFSLDVQGVAPGIYDLAPFFLDGGTAYTGRTTLQIGNQDIDNVTAAIRPNVSVTGRITSRESLPFEKWRAISMELRSRDVPVPLMGRSGIASIRPDGTFTIGKVVEGRYQLYIGAATGAIPPDLYISAVRQAGLDLQDEGTIDVRDGMPQIEITLSSGAGLIEGTVENALGSVPARADVVLVPQLSRRKNVMYYDRTTIDSKGRFMFTGIAPGEYKVFAFDQLADSAERNQEFLVRYETLGESVTISSTAPKQVRVRVLRD
jgi:hypothetical protein